jgi:hypothetical protein
VSGGPIDPGSSAQKNATASCATPNPDTKVQDWAHHGKNEHENGLIRRWTTLAGTMSYPAVPTTRCNRVSSPARNLWKHRPRMTGPDGRGVGRSGG